MDARPSSSTIARLSDFHNSLATELSSTALFSFALRTVLKLIADRGPMVASIRPHQFGIIIFALSICLGPDTSMMKSKILL